MQKIQKYSHKKAFTLAEVLITLVIIGVIAALTIPALIQNIQDAQYKAAWKETYSFVNQATSRILADNGGTFMNYFQNSVDMRDRYATYLSVSGKCDIGTSYGNCFPATGDFKFFNGIVLTAADINNYFGAGSPSLKLNNGSSILFGAWPNCGVHVEDNKNYCGWITVDVNGPKEPNTIGKDIYRIWVLDKSIIPQGKQGSYTVDNCYSHGFGCGAMYLQQ